jgi:tRNA modification GTPase
MRSRRRSLSRYVNSTLPACGASRATDHQTLFSTSDTIVAVATPSGRGGIGVVRLSGPAAEITARTLLHRERPLHPRHATFVRIASCDQVVATYFPAPRSYTGEDVIELSAHGSPVVLAEIVSAAMAAGCRLAEPGEFTLRAFLNGRIDLPQAEAVADLIDAATPLQARAAFDQLEGTLTDAIGEIDRTLFDLVARLEASVDFSEADYHFVAPRELSSVLEQLTAQTSWLVADGRRGRLVREGLQLAIVGKPNVGKSSLFNALAGASRAIVTDVPGTTRDLITEVIDLEGLRVTLVDTAGLRPAMDPVEAEGVTRARRAREAADLVLVVVDGSRPLDAADDEVLDETAETRRVVVSNKSDLGGVERPGVVHVSARTGEGLDALRASLLRALDVETRDDPPAITNLRHIALLERAHDALCRARSAAGADGDSLPGEFVLADLQEARAALEEISGRRTPDDVLAHIFARFCIGK